MHFAFLQNTHFSFIYCIEDLVYDYRQEEWESCYEKLGLDSTRVNDCYRSEHGKEVSSFRI
jgi:interferon gamma-inducible protein 30